jgi:hypothetical protein
MFVRAAERRIGRSSRVWVSTNQRRDTEELRHIEGNCHNQYQVHQSGTIHANGVLIV